MAETFQHLLFGFSIALEPINLLYAFLGCLVGTIIGVLPGLGPAGGMALLIPLIYGKSPASAVILLAGIYYGAMYGGSTTSILLNLPGEAASVVTTLDGYQMAKKGRAGPALCIAAIGSFIAGTISVVLLMFIGPPMAHFALKFGPAESFALMVFGLSTVSSLAGSSLIKGAVATIFGLMLATIGVDLPTGINRYIFGIDKLMEGFDIIVAAIGLFAVSEIFMALEEMAAGTLEQIKVSRIWISMRDFLDSLGAIIRGTFLGFVVGAIPGAAHVTASFFSYSLEKKFSKNPENFGKGEIRGVAGPESANNAALRRPAPSFDLRPPGFHGHGRPLWRSPDGGGEAQSVPVPKESRNHLGLGGQYVHRQHHAPHLESAPRRPLCPDPFHPGPLASADRLGGGLCRRLQRPQLGPRSGPGYHPWDSRLLNAKIRFSFSARHPRPGFGRLDGAVAPPGLDDFRRKPRHPLPEHHRQNAVSCWPCLVVVGPSLLQKLRRSKS